MSLSVGDNFRKQVLTKKTYFMLKLTNDLLIDKIRLGDNASFELLYKFCFPSIANFIRKNSGNNADAEDVFQEAILVLLQKVKEPNFYLTASLKTYLFAVAQNLWLKQLKAKKQVSYFNDLLPDHISNENLLIDLETEKSLFDEDKVKNWLGRITINCQEILKFIYFLNQPIEKLRIKMGWKNKHTAANLKYKCLSQLIRESKKESVK
jgi:RNA polymerase sigma factor (sigma-70 family)